MNEEQKREIDRNRAFGLLCGLAEGVSFSLKDNDRRKVDQILSQAKELWDGPPKVDAPLIIGRDI